MRSLTLTATTSGRFDGRFFKYIDEEIPADSEFWLRDGDLLIQRGNTIEYVGVAAVYRGPPRTFIYPDLMMKVRVSGDVDLDFIHMALNGPVARRFIMSRASGTSGSMPKINQATLLAVPIPLPPLAEQKRIVARVHELMRLLDDLEAKQAKKWDSQARLRTAALSALTSAGGHEEFDAAWLRVLENFGVLFERSDSLKEARAALLALSLEGWLTRGAHEREASGDGLPHGWWRGTLGELASFVTSGSRNWKNYYAAKGAVFIRSQDIKTDALDISTPAFVRVPKDAEGTRTRVEKNDILITITGANVGKAAHVDREIPEAYVSQHVALVRLRDASLAPWVQRWLISQSNGRGQLLGSSYGDKPGLNLNQVKSVVIDIPPAEEREIILEHVRRKWKLCDDLEAKLKTAEETASKLVEAAVAEMVE